MKRRLGPAETLLGILMFLLLWQLLAWTIRRPIMPAPGLVLPLFFKSILGELGLHLLVSTGRVLAAILVSVLTAVPKGMKSNFISHQSSNQLLKWSEDSNND